VILSNEDIKKARAEGALEIDPAPEDSQYDTSSVNLRVGDDFHVWKSSLRTKGCGAYVNLDLLNLTQIRDLSDPLPVERDGYVVIHPGAFVLVPTLEHVRLPLTSRLAARVEGRSKFARLGLSVHITAPTIHAGFAGPIVLEVLNHGPFELRIWPNKTELCQLIFEEVKTVPQGKRDPTFAGQATAFGKLPPKG
jgi:dCTP deaminase